MKKRTKIVSIAIVLVVLGAIAAYALASSRAAGRRGVRLGKTCVHSTSCFGAPCIHDAHHDDYCSKLCKSNDDCPASWECDHTYRGDLACMKKGHIPRILENAFE